jgi:hypothetical protein
MAAVCCLPFDAVCGGHNGRRAAPDDHLPPRDRDWQPNEQAAFAWDGDKAFWPHLLQISATGPVDCRVIAHPPLSGGQHDRKALAKRCRAIIESALPAVDQKPEADTR